MADLRRPEDIGRELRVIGNDLAYLGNDLHRQAQRANIERLTPRGVDHLVHQIGNIEVLLAQCKLDVKKHRLARS